MSRRITIRLEDKLSDALTAECRRRGTTTSEVLRQALEDALPIRTNPAPTAYAPASPPKELPRLPESVGAIAAHFLGQPDIVRPEARRLYRELLAACIAAQRTWPRDPIAAALPTLLALLTHFGVAETDV